MPKGKRPSSNRQNRQDAPEAQLRNVAPQAVAHRRGGTHRVKDEHKTNTIFDEWDYKQLKAECIERGIYIKDMKKVEMARILADNDRKKKRVEREAMVERANKQQQLAREKQREDDRRLKTEAAKIRRRLEKQAKKDKDENVSEDTPDEEELQMMHNEMIGRNDEDGGQVQVGQALSEESWDSTSTETTFRSTDPPIRPECTLRLFEWPYTAMPSPVAPPSAYPHIRTPGGSILPGPVPRVPRNILYVPLKVHTTESKEKMFLPGQTYPAGVDSDYVPIISQHTRNAARNGHLEGVLRKATIEPASAWTSRTQIQGWNALMFFSLPPRNEAKKLSDVYNKWYLKNRKLLRVKPTHVKADRERRHMQRYRNTKRKLLDVLDASEWRPLAVCYLPAYLDFDTDRPTDKEERTVDNLFYIRFPGCDVPHYYFWTRQGDWADPTVANPKWEAKLVQQEEEEGDERNTIKNGTKVAQKRLPSPPKPARKTLVRVKNSTVPSPHPPTIGTLTQPAIASTIEHHLYVTGLTATLSFYRTKWLANGKISAWNIFARKLALLYPSGKLPSVPPVRAEGAVSVAMKIASIDMVGNKTLLPPFSGDEAWTGDDDVGWDVVEAVVEDDGPEAEDRDQDTEEFRPVGLEALYRRTSIQLPSHSSIADCAAWLETMSPMHIPLTPGSLPLSPNADASVREEWEEQVLQPGMDVVCPFCLASLDNMGLEAQASHLYAHSATIPSSHRRSSSLEVPCIALPAAARQISSLIVPRKRSYFDLGAEIENEKTPNFTSKHSKLILRVDTKTKKKRRVSQITYKPPDTASSHIPSPYLPVVRRWPEGQPNAAWNPRKGSCSTFESLEFLDEFGGRRMKKPRLSVRIDQDVPQNDFASPTKCYELKSRRSKIVEPMQRPSRANLEDGGRKAKRAVNTTYRDMPASSTTPASTQKTISKKRRRFANSTYRDRPTSAVSSDGNIPTPPIGSIDDTFAPKAPAKKRKTVFDTTYREHSLSSSSSENDVPVPRVKKPKRHIQQVCKDVENSTPLLRRCRKSVDLNFEFCSNETTASSVQENARKITKWMKKFGTFVSLAKRDEVKEGMEKGRERIINGNGAGEDRGVRRVKVDEAEEGWCSVM